MTFMKVDIYDNSNKKVETTDLPEGIFGVKWNPDLVHQAITAYMANGRRPWAHTKDRGDVRGGGKKPWRQKGTGRARHGSIRSPLWSGGGVTFGPTNERNFKKKINKKMRRKALFMALSSKVRDGEILVVDTLALPETKTKQAASMLKSLTGVLKENKKTRPSVLVVPAATDKTLEMSTNNIARTDMLSANNLHSYDVLAKKYIILAKDAVDTIDKTFKI